MIVAIVARDQKLAIQVARRIQRVDFKPTVHINSKYMAEYTFTIYSGGVNTQSYKL